MDATTLVNVLREQIAATREQTAAIRDLHEQLVKVFADVGQLLSDLHEKVDAIRDSSPRLLN